jgi:hypothetical protein
MRWLIALLAFINGAFMTADGLHVLIKGKYIGPEKPGPWSMLFESLGINVFQLGPMFLAFGIAWLVFLLIWMKQGDHARHLGKWVALLTLWYLPIGTIFSLAVLILLYRLSRPRTV